MVAEAGRAAGQIRASRPHSWYAVPSIDSVSPGWFTWRYGWTGTQADRHDCGWPGRSCPVGRVGNASVGPACPTSLVVSCAHGSCDVRVARCEWAAYWPRPARIHQRLATAPCLRFLTRSETAVPRRRLTPAHSDSQCRYAFGSRDAEKYQGAGGIAGIVA